MTIPVNITQEFFKSLSNLVPKKQKRYRRISMLIAAAINEGIKKKDKNQKWLSDKLEKKESQISKWLTGDHNFTIKTIIDIEDALDTEILSINYIRTKSVKDEPKPFQIYKFPILQSQISATASTDGNMTLDISKMYHPSAEKYSSMKG